MRTRGPGLQTKATWFVAVALAGLCAGGVGAARGGLLAVLFGFACHSRSLRSPNRLISGGVHGIAEQHVEDRLGGRVWAAEFAGASRDVDPEPVVDGCAGPEGQVPETVRLGRSLGDNVLEAIRASKTAPATPFRFSTSDVPLPDKWNAAPRPVRVLIAAIDKSGWSRPGARSRLRSAWR